MDEEMHRVFGKIFMTDDPLIFLARFIHLNLRNYTNYINIIKVIMVLYVQIFNVIGIFFIYHGDTRMYMRQYLSFLMAQQMGVAAQMLNIYYIQSFFDILDLGQACLLPLDAAGPTAQHKIIHECTLMKKILVVLYAVCITVIMSVTYNAEDYQFPVMFIKKYVAWPYLFLGLYYLCIMSLSYAIFGLCSMCIYVVTMLKFQLHLLFRYFRQISCGFIPNKEDIFYQATIQKRLKSFVQAHNRFAEYSVIIIESGNWILLVSMAFIILFYSSAIYLMMVSDVNVFIKLISVIIMIIAVATTFTVVTSGQMLLEESRNVYRAACECEWIYWNVGNQRTLQMILIDTSREVKLNGFGVLDLEHKIMLQILKVSYTLVLFLSNVSN